MSGLRQPVVVGYDGSADADRALAWAVHYAKPRGNPLRVLASSGDLEYLPEWTIDEQQKVAREWLDLAEERLGEVGFSDYETVASSGRVSGDLIHASAEAALVVLGAQGHGAISGFLIGSVSQHVTRHAACPVVVVRGEHARGRSRIVVGVDGSEASTGALEFAFDEASWTGSSLTVITARSVSAVNGPFDIDIAPEVESELDSARRMAAESIAGLREKYPDVSVSLEAIPMPAVRALVDASSTAALVVVGTRGLGGFTGLLLGSVGAGVMQHAECTVAVIR